MVSSVVRRVSLIVVVCLGAGVASSATPSAQPVTPHASTEARALLRLLYDISGRFLLAGQHNYPSSGDANSQFAARYIGRTPVVFSSDWGFAEDGDKDSYLARPDVVAEAIRQHRQGGLVTLCWHAVPPTADEPVTFQPQPDRSTVTLTSVQGSLSEEQFTQLLTPGTALNTQWCSQVDAIAVFLKQLEQAHVPILWRPYHEMNGDWFWWGGHDEDQGTAALYRQLFDRLVRHHRLSNLLWVWSVDRVRTASMEHGKFFPGAEFVDILALDVYGNDFDQKYYNSLAALSQGKPLVLGEVGNPPAREVLDAQPRWAYFVTWAGMVRNTMHKQYDTMVEDTRVLFLEDTAYAKVVAPYRSACTLPQLSGLRQAWLNRFVGSWVLNEELSTLDGVGASRLPYRLGFSLDGDLLQVQRTVVLEYTDAQVTSDVYSLDGTQHHSVFMGASRTTTVTPSPSDGALLMTSTVVFDRRPRPVEMVTEQIWRVGDDDTHLSNHQTTTGPFGKSVVTLVYDRDWLSCP